MKVTIIGAGRVGSTTAFCLMERGLAQNICLVDVAGERARGEGLDLMHCSSSLARNVSVSGSDDYAIAKGSDIVVITAGIPRKPGDTRLDLLKKNTGIMKDITGELAQHCEDPILLVVSNPVDVMTYVAYKTSKLDHKRVFGLGTMLDTLRFRSLMVEKLNLPPQDVSTLMLGEHGDSMFPVYSQTFIRQKTVEESGILGREDFYGIADYVRESAAEVIKLKGATYYAPAVAVCEVVDSVVGDKKRILPVSVYSQEHDIYVSTLAKVGAFGVQYVDTRFNDEERESFAKSVGVLKNACAQTGV
ncbi:MAG: malate dehydrogenase [Candidatus Altiarchaeota archaeon]